MSQKNFSAAEGTFFTRKYEIRNKKAENNKKTYFVFWF
jgi:hypothetical protein